MKAFRERVIRVRKQWSPVLLRMLRRALITLGGVALVLIALAFTRIPFDAHRRLGTAAGICHDAPGYILVLGGSGMPSGAELLRLHHAAQVAALYPSAGVVVVHPLDSGVVQDMVDELVLRGVGEGRIQRVMEGTNTREQVLRVGEVFPRLKATRVAIVTAPENMYRSVKAFRKAGFVSVCGVPAFEHAMFVDLQYDHRMVGGRAFVPDVSGSNTLRYDLWHHLRLEVILLREYLAISYYWLNGWI